MLKKEDKLILYALTENCRFNNAFIGKIAGLNSKTVKKRIQFLEKEGIIEKYYATSFYSAIGVARYSEVFIEMRENETAVQKICSIPEVGSVTSYSGKWNLGMSLHCSTMEHCNKILDKIKQLLGEDLQSLTVLNYHKSRFLNRDYVLEGVKGHTVIAFAPIFERNFPVS